MPEAVNLKVAECDEALFDVSNDPFVGQYPILVYKHWFIPRKYIWEFWCKLSALDDDLSPA